MLQLIKIASFSRKAFIKLSSWERKTEDLGFPSPKRSTTPGDAAGNATTFEDRLGGTSYEGSADDPSPRSPFTEAVLVAEKRK